MADFAPSRRYARVDEALTVLLAQEQFTLPQVEERPPGESPGYFISRRHGVNRRAREAMRSGVRVGICHPVLGALWGGMELSSSRDRNIERMRHACGFSRLT